ncbi:MAG: ComEC/Rec2 family competence protein, partial [Henriciella sp.]
HFDRLAPLGLAANVLAMPIITFVSAPVAGLALLTWPLGLSDFFLSLFGWSLERVLSIAEWAADAGGEGFSLGAAMPPLVLVLLIAGLIACCLAPSLLRSVSVAALTVSVAWGVNALSPQMVLHASSSGDVYVRDLTGNVQLIALSDGEGLAPLRFSDLEPSMNCSLSACRLETIAGPVDIGPASLRFGTCNPSGARLVVSAEGPEELKPCTESSPGKLIYLRASDAPITVYKSVTGRLIVRQPICGQRPWAPCLDRD